MALSLLTKVALGALALVAVCILNYLWTNYQSRPRPHQGKEPPGMPDWIPGRILSNVYRYIGDREGMYNWAKQRSAATRNDTWTMNMGKNKYYIVSDPKVASFIFRNPKIFSFGPVASVFIKMNLVIPDRDVAVTNFATVGDKNPYNLPPLPPGLQPFRDADAELTHKWLQKPYLNDMTARFMRHFPSELAKLTSPSSDAYTGYYYLPFFRQAMFAASSLALSGTKIFEMAPHLADTFWTFDNRTVVKVRNLVLPKPSETAAMHKFQALFAAWSAVPDSDLVWDGEDGSVGWSPYWGNRINFEREKLMRAHGLSRTAIAAVHCALFWALFGNAIPVASWAVLHAFLAPADVLQQLREEFVSALLPAEDASGPLDFDMDALRALPLVQAHYKETIRLSTLSTAARLIAADTTTPDGYVLRAGNMAGVSSVMQQSDPAIFGSSPVGEFDARRFLAPDDPAREKRMNDNIRGYGGGPSKCPGRFFAEQEILGALGTMVLEFEMELEEGERAKVRYDKQYNAGSPLKEDVRVRVRRRKDRRSA